VGLSKLVTMPGRGAEGADVAALDAAWWGELADRPWVTAAVWARAVAEAFATCAWRPAFAEFLGICEFAATQLEQEAWRVSAPALPAPTVADDERATPAERERWAKEDAWIRGYLPGVLRQWEAGASLDDWGPHPTRPGVLIRTAPADAALLRAARERDAALSRVPALTIEQRRARDRRIEAAGGRARAAVRAGRWPGATPKEDGR
jgi:hypothetical protein